MKPDEQGRIGEIAGQLQLWSRKPGPGMALVQFSSEPARREVLRRLEPEEIAFGSGDDTERVVRELVDKLRRTESPLVSIRGLEDSFALGERREKAIDVLNFLRETIAGFRGRQIWWFTYDGGRLSRERAPDWLSWFVPRLELREDMPLVGEPADPEQMSTVSLESALARIADAKTRVLHGLKNDIPTVELWAELAYPALAELHRTGAAREESAKKAELLDLIYGAADDARRFTHMKEDQEALLRRGAYDSAVGLTGDAGFYRDEDLIKRPIDDLLSIGRAQESAGLYSEAERTYRVAAKTSEETSGPEHPSALRALDFLASFQLRWGRYSEAEPLYDQALERRARVLGKDHPATLTSVSHLASLYERQGRYSEAELLLTENLEALEKVLGADHPATLISVRNLAEIYRILGRYDESERLATRVLATHERLLGAEHPSTLASLSVLAVLYKTQGRLAEAEALFVRVLAASERVLGAEHPDTLAALSNLAALYESQERYLQAEPLSRRALAAFTRVLGTEHPNTLKTLNNPAVLLTSQGNYSEAEALCELVLTRREGILGAEHPDTLTALNNEQLSSDL